MPPRVLRKATSERAYVEPPRAPAAAASTGNVAPAARVVEVPPIPVGDVRPLADAPAAERPIDLDDDDEVGDDRHAIVSGDRVVLIVENELGFARLLLEVVREKGFKGIVTSSGVSALALASEYAPAAITLDIFLPDIDGWRALDRLKNDDQTRHIPVSVISTDESRERALKSGAYQFAPKPMQSAADIDALLDRLSVYLQRVRRHLLAVSPDPDKRAWFVAHLGAPDVKVTSVPGYAEAAAVLHAEPVDCLVFDAALDAPSDAVLLHEGNGTAAPDAPPILLYGDRRDVSE